jgi:hypothetical protein
VCLVGCRGKPIDLDTSKFEAVDIRLYDWAERQNATEVRSIDAVKIEALLAVLQSGEATKDHKCGTSGQITLHRKNGSIIKIGILAGHDPNFYEFRVFHGERYDIFRTDRDRFLKAMADLGVNKLDPGLPE